MKLLEIRRPGVESAAVSGMAYDAMHAAGGLRQLDSFYLWLLRLLAPTKGARLLDVSCGQGVLLRFAARAGLEAHGLDFSSVALRRARESSPGAALVAGDGERLPYRDGSFDYVISIGSLEHYLSPARAVSGDGARAGAAGPGPGAGAQHLRPPLEHLRGLAEGGGLRRRAADPALQHAGAVAGPFGGNGLRVVAVKRYEREVPRTLGDLLWYLRRPKKALYFLLSPLVPLNLAGCFVFLCWRRGEGSARGEG